MIYRIRKKKDGDTVEFMDARNEIIMRFHNVEFVEMELEDKDREFAKEIG